MEKTAIDKRVHEWHSRVEHRNDAMLKTTVALVDGIEEADLKTSKTLSEHCALGKSTEVIQKLVQIKRVAHWSRWNASAETWVVQL